MKEEKNKPDYTIVDVRIEKKFTEGDIDLAWVTVSAGFGHIAFTQKPDGTITCMNETMGKDVIRTVLDKLIDKAILDDQ